MSRRRYRSNRSYWLGEVCGLHYGGSQYLTINDLFGLKICDFSVKAVFLLVL